MERKRKEEFVDQSVVDPMAQEEALEEPQDEALEEGENKEDKKQDPIMKYWETRESGPSNEQIDAWKRQFGEVYLMSFDVGENYVWRPITRLEYKNILEQAKNDPHYQEMIVQRCVLWPQIGPETLTGGKAGTVPTLHAVIMEGSNFLEPDQAVMLVRKL